MTIRDNVFRDCRGCDFIHGRAGPHLVIERNRFLRALPCRRPVAKCRHQDLIELFLANRLVISGNVFGVTRLGGGQVLLSRKTNHVRIQNNVFHATDPRVPGVTVRRGLVIGQHLTCDVPRYVRVVNNLILAGDRPGDDGAAAIRMSVHYRTAPLRYRPVIANNILSRVRYGSVCVRARRSVRNVFLRGTACSASDVVGDPLLDAEGRPTADSALLIDRAAQSFAPPLDMLGRARVGPPDIGAFEYVP